MEWPNVRVGDVCDVVIGATPARNRPEYWGGGYVWVTVAELNDDVITTSREHITDAGVAHSASKLIPAGTLLFSFKLSIGKMAFAGVDLYTNEAIAALPIRHRNLVDHRYLFYALRSIGAIPGANVAAKGKVLNRSVVESLPIPLPPLSEQRRIVEILDQADHLRRLRAEADAKAARMLPALFIKMFGDPATNPMGWPVKTLGDLTKHLTSGSRGWSIYTGRGPAYFLRTQDINDGDIADDLLRVDPPDGAEAERTRLAVGDVAITITGVVGKAAVFRGHDQPVYISQHVALVRPKADELCSEYLAAYANLPVGDVPVLARFQYGQTKPGLGFQELRTARILLAPLELQNAFAERVTAVQVSRHAGAAASKTLTALWTSLFSRAFSGDLTEPWREAHMKDLLQEMEHQAKALAATARPE